MTIRKRQKKSREQWLKWRESNVNASEAASLFGIDPYRTALQLYYEKTGVYQVEETREMRRGRWFESAAIAAIQEKYPDWKIEVPNCYFDDPDTRMGCTPDAFIVTQQGKYNLQIKVISEFTYRRWANDDDDDEEGHSSPDLVTVPLHYQLQTNIETNMTDCIGGKLGALILERAEIYIFDVPKHTKSFDAVKVESDKFWYSVKNETPPPLDARNDADLIKRLYPTDNGSIIDLSSHPELIKDCAEEVALAKQLSEINKTAKPYKEKRDDIRTKVKSLMGSATCAILPGYEITWKAQERKASTSRVMRIKPNG